MTFNTGNPIGSTDARDRLDNSENMDILENSTTLNAHPDRLGTMRKTRKGMEDEHDAQIAAHEVEHANQMQSFENDFDSRLAGMAFTRVGTFTTGATLTDMRQTLLWEVSQGGDGHEYGWSGSFLPSGKVVAAGSTPAATGGVGAGAWVDRTDSTLRSQLLSNAGSEFVSHKRSGASNSVALSMRDILDGVFCNLAVEYDIDRTGLTDVTTLLQTAINEVSALGIKGYLPAGKYKITPENGTVLDSTTYSYGDTVLRAGIVIPYGWDLITDGTSTQFCFSGLLSASSVGVAIGEDGTTGVGFSHKSHEQDGFMIRAMSSEGRYGILTPKSDQLFTRKRPKYRFRTNIHFCGSTDNLTVLYNPIEGWNYGIRCGDCYVWDAKFTIHGSYNPNTSFSGQTSRMVGAYFDASVGSTLIRVNGCQAYACYKAVDFGDGVEGFNVTECEFLGVYYGVVTSNTSDEPGGFIDNTHVNAVKEAYRIANRPYLHMGNIEAYRSSAFYTDGAGWYGVRLINSEVNINHLSALPSDNFIAETGQAAIHADADSVFTLDNYNFRSLYQGFIISGANDCKWGDGTVNSVDRICTLGSSATDIQGGEVRVRNSAPSYYFTTDGTVNKGRLSFPQKSLISAEVRQEITVTAAGKTTVKPRLTPSRYEIDLSSGTYAYNIILDHETAIDGDTVDIKLVTASNVNAALNIYTGSISYLLSRFATASSARFYLRYEYSATNNLWRELIMACLDATY